MYKHMVRFAIYLIIYYWIIYLLSSISKVDWYNEYFMSLNRYVNVWWGVDGNIIELGGVYNW